MDKEFSSTPVSGDGVATLPPFHGVNKMPDVVDLSPNVANMFLSETAANVQANNRDGRAVATAAINALTAGVAKTHNELQPAESRAVSGLIGTPIASPTTQS